jgi:hypothetical protein
MDKDLLKLKEWLNKTQTEPLETMEGFLPGDNHTAFIRAIK